MVKRLRLFEREIFPFGPLCLLGPFGRSPLKTFQFSLFCRCPKTLDDAVGEACGFHGI